MLLITRMRLIHSPNRSDLMSARTLSDSRRLQGLRRSQAFFFQQHIRYSSSVEPHLYAILAKLNIQNHRMHHSHTEMIAPI